LPCPKICNHLISDWLRILRFSFLLMNRRPNHQEPNLPETTVTNARIASFHGLSVVRKPPDHAHSTSQNRALVTSGHPHCGARAVGFRLRLGGSVSLRLRSSRLSVCAPLSPLADRRPKPEIPHRRAMTGLAIQ
jgi:hypothetical protein